MNDTLTLGREEMLSKLADADDDFATWLLSESSSNNSNSNAIINGCLRKNTLSLNIVPVVCGSALRCTESVRPVLNLVARFFPAPVQRNNLIRKVFEDELSALVFKINHDKRHGQNCYVRIYTGTLKNGSSLYNASRDKVEDRVTTFFPYSDVLKPVDFVQAGEIAVVSGLHSTVTGDTLLQSESSFKRAKQRLKKSVEENVASSVTNAFFQNFEMDDPDKSVLLAGIRTPDPVFFCSIEPPDSISRQSFEKALREITIEDPSVRVRLDNDTLQTVIEAMGELHIEIVKDRLYRDYGLKVFMGPLQVAYREIFDGNIAHSATASSVVGERKMKHECSVTLEIFSDQKARPFEKVELQLQERDSFLRPEWIKAVNEGCANALLSGPVLGFPVMGVKIALKLLNVSGGRILPSIISASACKCVREALSKVTMHLIEPVMEAEVELTGSERQNCFNAVIQEITSRRGIILKMVGKKDQNHNLCIFSRIPVAETLGFSNALRSLTSGLGTLHMRVAGYVDVPPEQQNVIVQKVKRAWIRSSII
ncbi:unnamed protein product [Enterobius vermicularis]|uniref:EFG_C domain-containing protein n=1 Tax=Enterobius vermicularis TaxID=51028 RepID=A0A0N4V7C7_ENTVE|nr:unnamed protein product [Enterobius vermicularis]